MDMWAREAGREENKHTAELQHGKRWREQEREKRSRASGWHNEIMEIFHFSHISSPPFLCLSLGYNFLSFFFFVFSVSKLNSITPLCFVKCLWYESLYESTYDSCLYIYIKFNSGNTPPPDSRSPYYSQSNSIQIPLEHISRYYPCTISFGGGGDFTHFKAFTCPAWIDVE